MNMNTAGKPGQGVFPPYDPNHCATFTNVHATHDVTMESILDLMKRFPPHKPRVFEFPGTLAQFKEQLAKHGVVESEHFTYDQFPSFPYKFIVLEDIGRRRVLIGDWVAIEAELNRADAEDGEFAIPTMQMLPLPADFFRTDEEA